MKNVSALALIAVLIIGLTGCNMTGRFGCLRALRGAQDCCSPCQDSCGGCESCSSGGFSSGGCSSCGVGGGSTIIEGAPVMQGETYTVPSPVTLPAPATYVPSTNGANN